MYHTCFKERKMSVKSVFTEVTGFQCCITVKENVFNDSKYENGLIKNPLHT